LLLKPQYIEIVYFEVIMSKMVESIDFKNIGYLKISFSGA